MDTLDRIKIIVADGSNEKYEGSVVIVLATILKEYLLITFQALPSVNHKINKHCHTLVFYLRRSYSYVFLFSLYTHLPIDN